MAFGYSCIPPVGLGIYGLSIASSDCLMYLYRVLFSLHFIWAGWWGTELVMLKVSLVHQGWEVSIFARGDGGWLVIMAHHIAVKDEYKHKLIQNLQFLTTWDIYFVIFFISSKRIKYVFCSSQCSEGRCWHWYSITYIYNYECSWYLVQDILRKD